MNTATPNRYNRVLLWGIGHFCLQTLVGILLPFYLLPVLGTESLGQLSFFFVLLHPVFWFELTGSINHGLYAKLHKLSPSQIRKWYAATWFWWLLLWALLLIVADWKKITLFSSTQLLLLGIIPFCVFGGGTKVLHYFAEKSYERVYQLQIFLTSGWLLGVVITSTVSDPIQGILIVSLVLASLFYSVSLGFFSKAHAPKLTLKKKFKTSIDAFSFSIQKQKLFALQAALGILATQGDRILIAQSLSWEHVAYYFVPFGLLMKLPALLAVFFRPVLAQLALLYWEGNLDAIRYYLKLTTVGVLFTGILAFIPLGNWISPLLEFWLNPQFAEHATVTVQWALWLLPGALLMMVGQAFLIALDHSTLANNISIVVVGLHWFGTWLGVKFFGASGAGFGLIAEALGAFLMLWHLIRILELPKKRWKIQCISTLGACLSLILVTEWVISSGILWIRAVMFLLQLFAGILFLCWIWKKRNYENSNSSPFFS